MSICKGWGFRGEVDCKQTLGNFLDDDTVVNLDCGANSMVEADHGDYFLNAKTTLHALYE